MAKSTRGRRAWSTAERKEARKRRGADAADGTHGATERATEDPGGAEAAGRRSRRGERAKDGRADEGRTRGGRAKNGRAANAGAPNGRASNGGPGNGRAASGGTHDGREEAWIGDARKKDRTADEAGTGRASPTEGSEPRTGAAARPSSGRADRATETGSAPVAAPNGKAASDSGLRGRERLRGAAANGARTSGRAASHHDGASALTPEQLKRIEQRLLQERELAIRTLVGTRTDIQRHPISDMRREEMDIHLAERHSEFLSLIDSALRRLRESPEDFHLSVVSGHPIPFERLEMVPWTRRLTTEMGLPARWSES